MYASVVPFLRRLFHMRTAPHGTENPRSLLKWVLISTLIGLVAGLGAIAFYAAIHLATLTFLGGVVGYTPPSPAGEGGGAAQPFWSAARPWLLPLVTSGGGLLSGLLVFSLAPEAEGHGTDAAINAFHKGTTIRARIPLIKLVASAITIGTGGSAGREGPVAQISAGFGSLLGTVLKLNQQDRRIALAAGIGAGIGAIFSAPLGGAVLAAEILYTNDLEVEAVIPALISSIVGYSLFGAWSGWHPLFTPPTNLAFTSPPQLLYYIVLGVLCGLVGVLYARGFYGITTQFHRLHLPTWLKPAIGGLLVGCIALAVPQAMGMGYGWVQIAMGQGVLSIPLWILFALPFVKILTTGLSIGSGGSGGIFGPGMVIGGMLGAAVWRLCSPALPGLPDTPAPFVIVGMMALFGGIAHAPLAVMLMVAEMTGNLSMLAPAMLAVGISSLIVGSHTIYTSQLPTRADSPAHRLQFSFPLLSTLVARRAMKPLALRIQPDWTLAQAEQILTRSEDVYAPVIDANGKLVGTLSLAELQRVPQPERGAQRVETVMQRNPPTVAPDETLDKALEQLSTGRMNWAPVLDLDREQVAGVISTTQIMRAYRQAVSKDVRRMRGWTQGTVMREIEIQPQMCLAGKTLRDAHLPNECLVVSIRRQHEQVFPRGSTTIQAGDIVTFMVSPLGEERLHRYLRLAEGASMPRGQGEVRDERPAHPAGTPVSRLPDVS